MNNVNEYRAIIERFAHERINQRVSNGMAVHAAVLLETMFKHAAAEMRIYTGELHQDVFGQSGIVDAAKGFLSKPYARLRILIQKKHDLAWVHGHPLLKAINDMAAPHGDLEVRFASGVYASDQANHFAVMDNDGYRFELQHENCQAVANFNEPRVAKNLLSVFDQAFELGVTPK